MNILIPNYVNKALEILKQNNFKAYIIGGAVRDLIIKLSPDDFDITTNASVNSMRLIFPKYFETGVKHGTLTVLIDNKPIEITTFRIDGEYLDNRKPKTVEFTNNLKEDVLRRDFTINAIAYNNDEGIIDYVNGTDDINNKIIRCVGNPKKRFNEDALRILRAIRFSACLEFEIEEETKKAIITEKYLLKNISAERINSELTKMLLKGKNINELNLISDVIFDGLTALLEDEKYCENILKMPEDISLKFSALLYGLNLEKVSEFLNKYKFSNKEKTEIKKLIENKDISIPNNISEIKFLLNKYGILFLKKLIIFKSIIENKDFSSVNQKLETIISEKQPYLIKDLKINGTDLLNIGIEKQKISDCFSYLIANVIKNPQLNDKLTLINMAKENFYCH